MPERQWQDFLDDIRRAVGLMLDFTDQQTYQDLESDLKTQFAVIRCFEVIGEAAKRLPVELTQSYPDIPWKIMAGMRDRLIHGYDQVNIPMLWRTVQHDIPDLAQKLKQIN